MFLSQAWEQVVQEDDSRWIDDAIARTANNPNEPYEGLGAALRRSLVAGVCRNDLNDIARCLQVRVLFNIAYLLDGRAYPQEGFEHIEWGLFRTGEDGNPLTEQIGGLHESVLETDPTRREMRPRDA